MCPAQENTDIEAELDLPWSSNDNGDIVVHGPTRDVTIRRHTVFQVDEVRFGHCHDAIRAAVRLLTD